MLAQRESSRPCGAQFAGHPRHTHCGRARRQHARRSQRVGKGSLRVSWYSAYVNASGVRVLFSGGSIVAVNLARHVTPVWSVRCACATKTRQRFFMRARLLLLLLLHCTFSPTRRSMPFSYQQCFCLSSVSLRFKRMGANLCPTQWPALPARSRAADSTAWRCAAPDPDQRAI